jgi:4-hydroxybenzoate polyprenyltransferase
LRCSSIYSEKRMKQTNWIPDQLVGLGLELRAIGAAAITASASQHLVRPLDP